MVGHAIAAFTIHQVVGTTASFTGPIVFTNALGTLTAQVAGTFDRRERCLPGDLHEPHWPRVAARVSGSVTLEGFEDFATLRFTETITGRLCLD